MSVPSPESLINDTLRDFKHDKWGWVIYRTTYNDDAGWARFKEIINTNSREEIADSDVPELEKSLEWTFVSDRVALDGATPPQLRERFKAWRKEAHKTEQPRGVSKFIQWLPDQVPPVERYTFFIQVDEEVLRTVVYEAPQPDPWGEGHVNLVLADWEPIEASELGIEREANPDEEIYEPIDGCMEYDVGWMKIASNMVGPGFYTTIDGLPEVWYAYYRRPPDELYYY